MGISQEITQYCVLLTPAHNWLNLTLYMPIVKMSVRIRLSSGEFLQAFRDPHLGHLIWHDSVTGAKEVTNQMNSGGISFMGQLSSSWVNLKNVITLYYEMFITLLPVK